ncbi:MAG: DUF4139 domain-containing protein [bacterium]
MIKRTLIILLVSISILIGEFLAYSKVQRMQTTKDDRHALYITAYNHNLALINDIREIPLPSGTIKVNFNDIAKKIDPSSILLSFPSDHGAIMLLEQDFDTDIITTHRLLKEYIGKNIKLAEKNESTGEETIVTATLLNIDPKPIFLINNEIHIDHPGRIILPDIPKELNVDPTLAFLLDCHSEGPYPLEVSYLTEGLQWDAYYTFDLNKDETRGDLVGWVNIINESGYSYDNAHLTLIAGDIHRAKTSKISMRKKRQRAVIEADRGEFKEEEFFDYHMYGLPRTITLKNNQSKQIKLLSGSRIPVKKEFRSYGTQYYVGNYRNKNEPQAEYASVCLEFENKAANNLGIPLPGGTVRIYKKNTEGGIQLLGEDEINHTPPNKNVEIEIGKAFDITITRVQTDWQKIAQNQFEIAWTLDIANQKTEAVVIKIVEPAAGEWQIVHSSHDWTKKSAHQIEFTIIIPPRMAEKISYRMSVRQ